MKNKKNNKKTLRSSIKYLNKGFSLMETLIWVGIVGIFVGLVGITGMTFWDRAKVRAAKQEMNIFSAALLEYYSTEGTLPSEDEGLNLLIEKGYITKGKESIKDPWGGEYIYQIMNDGKGFSLKSLGSDKREGGEGTKGDQTVTSENVGGEDKNVPEDIGSE
jgi:general secretion pathway protein G